MCPVPMWQPIHPLSAAHGCLVSTDCHCWAAGLLTAEHGSGSCAVSSSSSSSPWPLQSAISGPNEGHCRGRPSLLLIIHCTPWLFIYRLFSAGWPDGPGAHQLNQLNSYQREIGKKRINTEQTWRGFTLTLTYTQHHIAAAHRRQQTADTAVSLATWAWWQYDVELLRFPGTMRQQTGRCLTFVYRTQICRVSMMGGDSRVGGIIQQILPRHKIPNLFYGVTS